MVLLEINFDTEGLYDAIVYSFFMNGILLIAFIYGLKYAIIFAKMMHVSGAANEWVVIIGANGLMKKAGVGLSTFRMPWDQVATFPSKVNKVEFSCAQVDKEMQGLQVSGMIIWSVYRDEQGPFNAYKNLGPDLTKKVPKTANDNLVAQASAIVRSQIANAELKELLTNRQTIRDAIMKGMKKQVMGWGVWLETVEIIDVQIMSGSLFKDLQAEFREQKRRDAELITLEIQEDLSKKGVEKELAMKKVTDKISIDLAAYKQTSNLRINDQVQKDESEMYNIREKIYDANHDCSLKTRADDIATCIAVDKDNSTTNIKKTDIDIKQVDLNRQKWDAAHEITKASADHELHKARVERELNRGFRRKDFEMDTKNIDQDILRYQAFEVTKSALRDKKVECRSSKMEPNDTINNMAKSWFEGKASQK